MSVTVHHGDQSDTIPVSPCSQEEWDIEKKKHRLGFCFHSPPPGAEGPDVSGKSFPVKSEKCGAYFGGDAILVSSDCLVTWSIVLQFFQGQSTWARFLVAHSIRSVTLKGSSDKTLLWLLYDDVTSISPFSHTLWKLSPLICKIKSTDDSHLHAEPENLPFCSVGYLLLLFFFTPLHILWSFRSKLYNNIKAAHGAVQYWVT